MKQIAIIVILLLAITIGIAQSSGQTAKSTEKLLKNVHWLGHAAIKITGKKTIYIDPYEIGKGGIADIIFITHEHEDHFSIQDIQKIKNDQTIIVGPSCVTKPLEESNFTKSKNIITVQPGDTISVRGMKVTVVPSYNFTLPNHSRDKGYVGYVIQTENGSYYHPGDTDFITEMKNIKADVAFLPVTAPYTMSPEKAAEAANAIKPAVAVPIHWGSVIGNRGHAEKFKGLCSCKAVIMERGKNSGSN